MTAADQDAGPRRLALIFALVFMTLVHLALLFLGNGPLSTRPLGGPDSYNRLVQVSELERSGDWYLATSPRSNAPHGEVRVWTRAFDIPLWLGAKALAPFVGFRDGLHICGILIGPVLHLLAIVALFWAVRPIVAGEGWTFIAFLLPFQFSSTVDFLPGRPDHHSAHALIFLLLWGFMLRLAQGRRDWRTVVLPALVATVGLWLSVEALIAIALLLVVTGVSWLRGVLAARTALAMALVLTLSSALVLPVERRFDDWLVADFDRISIVHVWVFVTISGFWLLAAGIEALGLASSFARRLTVALIGVPAVALAVWLTYPEFFAGPMAQVMPEIVELWEQHVSEYKPSVIPGDPRKTAYMILVFFGLAPFALVYLPFGLRRMAPGERGAWVVTGALMLSYLPLALAQIRWAGYAQLLALPIVAHVLSRIFAQLTRSGAIRVWQRSLAKLALLLVCATGTAAAGWTLRAEPTGTDDATAPSAQCDNAAAAAYLMRPDGFGDRPRRILTFIFLGPELLYRTHHYVVATPDHRNDRAIVDNIAFFGATDPEVAHAVVQKRGIDLVLFCPRRAERIFYRKPEQGSMLDRLVAHRPPPWLKPLALPEAAGDYRLYQVVK